VKAFEQLTQREQILLLGGAALLVVLGLWTYVWQPIVTDRAHQSSRIARYLSVIEIARKADAGGTPRPDAAVANATPLAPRITQSAEAAGIPLARLDPEGTQLRVTVAKTGYAEASAWIASLEARDGARVLSIEMSRLTEPAQISLRMTLEDAR
jgi:type II secretory pathway component PulM